MLWIMITIQIFMDEIQQGKNIVGSFLEKKY